MKKKKIIFSFLSVILLVVFMFFASFTVFKKDLFTLKFDTKDVSFEILTVWHIETFEGGSFSRGRFLENRAIEFESKNAGKIFFVKSLSMEQARLKIESGELPDLVSFGVGAGELFVNDALEIDEDFGVREDLRDYGMIKSKIYAVPYMLGGYVKIYKNLPKKPVVAINSVTKTNYNEDSVFKNITPYEAYAEFVKNKSDCFIGTQRDLVRIENRINYGSLENCSFEFLEGYSDMVQYFTITSKNQRSKDLCVKFIKYILSDSVQASISKIGMFSVLEKSIYTEGNFKDFEKILNKKIASVNAFTSSEVLKSR